MGLLPFLNNRKDEASILIDIGNGSLSTSIVTGAHSSKPTFVCTSKTNFPLLENVDSQRLVVGLESVLDSCLEDMLKSLKDHKTLSSFQIMRVLVSFSSPWFLLKTKYLHLVQDKSFVITHSFLTDIVKKEEKAFEYEIATQGDSQNKEAFEIIEKSIVNTRINGYSITDPIGKRTKIFEAFLCMSIVEKKIMKKIVSLVEKHLHLSKDDLITHTFPLIEFAVLRDLHKNLSDFLMIDITGEVTDVTLVKNDVVVKTASFPSGRNTILRQIAKTNNVSLEIAESQLHLFHENKLADGESASIQNLMFIVENEWSVYLENALGELSSDFNIPPKVFLTAEEDVASIYIDFMKMPKTDATSAFRKDAKVEHLDKKTLSTHVNFPPGMPVDEFMMIIAIFHNKFFHNRSSL